MRESAVSFQEPPLYSLAMREHAGQAATWPPSLRLGRAEDAQIVFQRRVLPG